MARKTAKATNMCGVAVNCTSKHDHDLSMVYVEPYCAITHKVNGDATNSDTI